MTSAALVVRLPLEIEGASASSTELALPGEMRVNDWERIGAQLEQSYNANLWWIADWASYGERRYRKQYPLLLEKLFSRSTLANYASVAKSVESSRRREDLSFSHHEAVAALAPEEQSEWLSDAFDHAWSVRELRERISAWKRGDRTPAVLPALALRPGELADLCRRAAERDGMDPVAWAASVLEREARQVLELEAA